MSEAEQIKHFGDELDALINRFRAEYDGLTYAAVVGTLHMRAHTLMLEAAKRAGELDDE